MSAVFNRTRSATASRLYRIADTLTWITSSSAMQLATCGKAFLRTSGSPIATRRCSLRCSQRVDCLSRRPAGRAHKLRGAWVASVTMSNESRFRNRGTLEPNVWCHPACGKLVFIFCDLLVARFTHSILLKRGAARHVALWYPNYPHPLAFRRCRRPYPARPALPPRSHGGGLWLRRLLPLPGAQQRGSSTQS